MLHLDVVGPRPPRLSKHLGAVLTPVAASLGLHLAAALTIGALVKAPVEPVVRANHAQQQSPAVRHAVFVAPRLHQIDGGGGGGGNRQPGPVRRAHGVGSDAITLRIRRPASPSAAGPVPDLSPLPSVILEAKPLASGTFEQTGLPDGGVSYGESTGTGSGGGVGTGVGSGVGSGHGPGVGPGSGGGMGGGVYHAGGAVTAPRVLAEVSPTYTNEALRQKIQGTVVLELVVTRDGRPSQIRVVRSLDSGGLDEQAIAAARQWRFEPGRFAGEPVDVLVTVMLDFWIR